MAIVDIATLKAYFENGDAPTEAQFANLIDSMLWKTYQTGVAYANGTPAVTMTATTPVKQYGYLVPYQTADGQWWMKGLIGYNHDSVASNQLTISGVECDGGGSQFPVDAYYENFSTAQVSAVSSNFVIDMTFTSAYNNTYASFDVPIAGKPTWAD